MPPKYTRVWGIQVGRWNGKVSVLINTEDDDDATATTAGSKAGSYASDSDMDTVDKEDSAAENLPRKPPEKLLYNGTGKSYKEKRADIPKRPGRLESVYVIPPEKSLPKPGTTCLPRNAGPTNMANQKICLSLEWRACPCVCPELTDPQMRLPINLFMILVQNYFPRVRPERPVPIMRLPQNVSLILGQYGCPAVPLLLLQMPKYHNNGWTIRWR